MNIFPENSHYNIVHGMFGGKTTDIRVHLYTRTKTREGLLHLHEKITHDAGCRNARTCSNWIR
ncbi:hypothetical protein BRE01_09910 [Brevibacillus reuszeri]|uniref:Uncharacterized protein n=1 Tax=Brevibacillus reuszeri TaxID=54915 RepID=A0ABQ0TI38_9BACL|nr:hypothetical protein BRE01_09910 [Brevibacillus reuszeri]